MGFDEEFKKHLEILDEGCTEVNPKDITIKSLALDGIIGEAWTNFLHYVWEKDDFFKRDLELYKTDLKTVGRKQAEINQNKRILEHLEKISKEQTNEQQEEAS